MESSIFWMALLTSIGGTAALLGLAVWLGKSWVGKRIEADVQHTYNAKLEKEKAELQKQIEQFKQELTNSSDVVQKQRGKKAEVYEKLVSSLFIMHRTYLAQKDDDAADFEEGDAEKKQHFLSFYDEILPQVVTWGSEKVIENLTKTLNSDTDFFEKYEASIIPILSAIREDLGYKDKEGSLFNLFG